MHIERPACIPDFMKKNLNLIIFGAIALLSACGSTESHSQAVKSYSGVLGTCSYTVNGIKFCTDYSFSGQFKIDPTNDAVATLQDECTSSAPLIAHSVSFDRSATCSRTGATGLCTFSSNEISPHGETMIITGVLVFPASVNTAASRSICAAAYGTHSSI